MAEFLKYSDINAPYLNAKYVSPNILYNFWQNNPLMPETLINARTAGYKPYQQIRTVNKINNFIDSDCPYFQGPCDEIKPVNKCYLKDRQIINQP